MTFKVALQCGSMETGLPLWDSFPTPPLGTAWELTLWLRNQDSKCSCHTSWKMTPGIPYFLTFLTSDLESTQGHVVCWTRWWIHAKLQGRLGKWVSWTFSFPVEGGLYQECSEARQPERRTIITRNGNERMDLNGFADFLREKVSQLLKEIKELLAIRILLTPKGSPPLPKWTLWPCKLNAALCGCMMFYDRCTWMLSFTNHRPLRKQHVFPSLLLWSAQSDISSIFYFNPEGHCSCLYPKHLRRLRRRFWGLRLA